MASEAKKPDKKSRSDRLYGDNKRADGDPATGKPEPESVPVRHTRERGEALDRMGTERGDMDKRHRGELEQMLERHAAEIDAGATPAGPVGAEAAPQSTPETA